MPYDSARRAISLTAGVALLFFGVLGMIYSLRAVLAQNIYHDVKFNETPVAFAEVEEKAHLAQQLYPINYRLCDCVAQKAWDRYAAAAGPDRNAALNNATEWSSQGINLNPYPRSMREVRRKCLEEVSLSDALKYWSSFVDWNFWDPYNHAVLLELHVRMGNVEGALSEMKWVRNSAYAARAVELTRSLIAREFTAPSEVR